MELLRTPPERFDRVRGFDHEPRHVDVAADDGRVVRMAYVDVGPPEADPVLCLHGEPTWSYVYRHVLDDLVAAGRRVVALDLVGFGRSDKPRAVSDHTYARHIAWTAAAIAALDLRRVTLVCQDWGGLIGLRVLTDDPARFARIVLANTGLPTGSQPMPELWQRFREVVVQADDLQVSRIVASGCVLGLDDDARAAYDAPFPDDDHMAGPRAMPDLVPQTPDDPEADANRRAWATLERLDLPVLVAFSDSDPITAPAREAFVTRLPGARDRAHPVIVDAGHFLQEDAGAHLALEIDAFITATGT